MEEIDPKIRLDDSTATSTAMESPTATKRRSTRTSSTLSRDSVTSTNSVGSSGSTTSNSGRSRRPLLNVAPLNTPLRNRLQTVGVIWHTISIPSFVCLFLLFVSLGWILWLTVVFPYFVWWYGFDLHTPTNGKVVYRVRDWMRNFIIWEWFVNYFPIVVHKTVDLEPTFSEVEVVEDDETDDEEDLISEDSRTLIDKIFKGLGLSKRLNDTESHSPPPQHGKEASESSSSLQSSTSLSSSKLKNVKYRRVSTGPRYIFGYHPHGVISMGVMGTFATNAVRNEPYQPPLKILKPFFHDPSQGERIFAGIGNIFPLTLTTQFTLPFYRDYLLGLGLTSASAKNIKSLINNGDNSVCIVVGGAQESLLNNMVSGINNVGKGYKGNDYDEEPKEPVVDERNIGGDSSQSSQPTPKESKRQIKLVLHKRKGFVKLAIELGNVSLVPIFAFGEADIYKLTIPEPGSLGYAFQQWMKKTFLFTVPFFSARGVFIYDFGFLPFRNPINVCVGRPIHIPQGVLAEYKLKHPEPEEPAPPPPLLGDKKISRKDSLSNLFKLGGQPKPKRPPVKTKMPPELLDHYHKLYVDELKRVYEENKCKYGYEDVELNIIE